MQSKTPPHNTDAERKLLAVIIYNGVNLEKVKGKLSPNDFYGGNHQKIFRAILDLDERGERIDLLTVNDILNRQGLLNDIGGPGYISELTDDPPLPSGIESAIKLIKQASNQRWLLQTVREGEQECLGGGDLSIVLSTLQGKIDLIKQEISYNDPLEKTFGDGIFDISKIDSLMISERQNIITPWLKEESITLISGPRGVGKSMLGIAITQAVTQKTSFGPWAVETSQPCLYLDGEMPGSDLRERFHLFENNLSRRSPLYLYSDHYASTLGLPRGNLLSETWRASIKNYLIEKGIRLWIVDNLASLTPGIDENLKKDWDPVNQFLLELRFAGIATIMLHHTGKDGGQRGTSAREDNLDISILLKMPSGYVKEDGCSFILSFTKARVSHKDIGAVSDHHFKLIDNGGYYTWQWGNVRKEIKIEVLQLLHNGEDYNAICETLDITKGYISRIKKGAIQEGHMDTKGRLTATGLELVEGKFL